MTARVSLVSSRPVHAASGFPLGGEASGMSPAVEGSPIHASTNRFAEKGRAADTQLRASRQLGQMPRGVRGVREGGLAP